MIVFFGLFIAGFSLIAFASTNAGVAPKHGLDEFGGDRYLAPPVIFGILLSMHSVAIGRAGPSPAETIIPIAPRRLRTLHGSRGRSHGSSALRFRGSSSSVRSGRSALWSHCSSAIPLPQTRGRRERCGETSPATRCPLCRSSFSAGRRRTCASPGRLWPKHSIGTVARSISRSSPAGCALGL